MNHRSSNHTSQGRLSEDPAIVEDNNDSFSKNYIISSLDDLTESETEEVDSHLLPEQQADYEFNDILRVTFGSVEIREYHVTIDGPSTRPEDNTTNPQTLTWDPHRITITTVEECAKGNEDTTTKTLHSSPKKLSKEEIQMRKTETLKDMPLKGAI